VSTAEKVSWKGILTMAANRMSSYPLTAIVSLAWCRVKLIFELASAHSAGGGEQKPVRLLRRQGALIRSSSSPRPAFAIGLGGGVINGPPARVRGGGGVIRGFRLTWRGGGVISGPRSISLGAEPSGGCGSAAKLACAAGRGGRLSSQGNLPPLRARYSRTCSSI
jgi:hypothetical protein